MPNTRDDLFIGQKAMLTRGGTTERVTIVPTHHRIPAGEVNVMIDGTGSVATVLVSQLDVPTMPELFTATYRDTGVTMTRDGAVIVATREEWAELGKVAGVLTPVPATVPLFTEKDRPALAKFDKSP